MFEEVFAASSNNETGEGNEQPILRCSREMWIEISFNDAIWAA